ncbi:MAG: TauD/TfdA family dioxygenase [Beijerinckiaceae bacterium]|nr:TauD/TfdA family dioxygenase [Beijerinckiaceae bacterium]
MALSVKPLDAPLGAEIVGLDVRNITPEAQQALHQALLDHHLLVIRNQPTADADLVELGKSFGPIVKARLVSPLTGRDDIMVISNIREDGKPVGQLPDGEMAFHIDQIYRQTPCKGAALHAVEIPAAGGDTMFSNNVRAYESLPDAMKKQLEGLMATHSFQYGETLKENRVDSPERPQYTHPLVRRIPENNKRALALCRLMTDRIEGLPEDQSRALIEELCDRIEDRGNIYSHEWRVGDILIWDNRCTSHARTDFATTERRLMKRVTIGDTQAPMA